jgi:hypothetical protein
MKDEKKLINDILKSKWQAIEKYISIMHLYLDDGDLADGYTSDDILKIMLECLSIIFGELNNKIGTLNKYEPKCYTDSDFVDMVIDSIGQELPSKDDKIGVGRYAEDFRIILWGYANHNSNRYFQLYAEMGENENTDEYFITLKECMTIVMVECILRSMERKVENL